MAGSCLLRMDKDAWDDWLAAGCGFRCGCCVVFGGGNWYLTAQSAIRLGVAKEATISALMVSDIHFDPFLIRGRRCCWRQRRWGSGRGFWGGRLRRTRRRRLAAAEDLPQRGEDTPYALLASSVQAMQRDGAGAKFVTVSGDLIAHAFQCKYGAVFPHAAAGDYGAFVEKTIEFVVEEVSRSVSGRAGVCGAGE